MKADKKRERSILKRVRVDHYILAAKESYMNTRKCNIIMMVQMMETHNKSTFEYPAM